MKRFLLFFFFLCFTLLHGQSGYTGSFQGVLNGDPTTVILIQIDFKVTGQYKETQNTYDINGEIKNDLLYGKIILPENQLLLGTFVARLIQNGIHMDITLLEVTKVSIDFKRTEIGNANSNTNTIATATASLITDNFPRDPKVVGNWIKEEVINSGAGTNAASFTLAYYLKFNADGSFIQEKGSSAGGSNWSGG